MQSPMVQPAIMAMQGRAEVESGHFQPNSQRAAPARTSLTMGAEIRNENVTPRGTPVVTNPMNRGTAEHEQKGVTTPNRAASTLPTACRRPASIRRVRSA